jgi:high-affinity iron transporter
VRALALVLLAVVLIAAPPARAEGATADDWHRVVGILQYLEGDYPAALESGSKFELDEQDAFIDEAVRAARELGPKGAGFVPRLEALQRRVNAREAPGPLTAEFAMLIDALVDAGGLSRSPRRPPDLQRGRELYAQVCVACHAADGSADVAIAKTMEPPPANFLDAEAMGGLSPYKGFNVISHGLPGTAMTAFKGAFPDAADRWALAFFVMTLRHPPCEGKTPRTTLEKVAASTDDQLAAEFGAQALPCLRHAPPTPNEDESLLLAEQKVRSALQLLEAGDANGARQAVLDAYLLGVEPVEPMLAARDPGLVRELEGRVLAMRVALERGADARPDGRALLELLDRARHAESGGSAWAVFWMALLIVLREGFEALVVVGALLAVLKKMGATAHAKVVHAGWVSALVAGAVAYFFAQRLLAGANREWMEGLVALAAVGMLLYAALWLNARANVSAFMKDLRGRMEGALGRGSAVGLFAISFSAVGRETFETALFLQGLALDSAAGAAWGGVAGLVVLGGMVAVVLRVGFRLPMKPLFQLSTAFLFGTAVILLGKGLHALQEVGAVPLYPVSFLRADLLGVYPDAVTLLAQAALALPPLVYLAVRRARRGAGQAQGAS